MPVRTTADAQNEKDDMLVLHMINQERDLDSHKSNCDRYGRMLTQMNTDNALANTVVGIRSNGQAVTMKEKYTQLREQEASRVAEVQAIIDATEPDLPETSRITASIARLKTNGVIPS